MKKDKAKGLNERIDKKALSNLNKTRSAKYGFSPNETDEKSLENNYFIDIYDFHRLVRVKEREDKTVRCMENKTNKKEEN